MADTKSSYTGDDLFIIEAGTKREFTAQGTHLNLFDNSNAENIYISIDGGVFHALPKGKSIPMPPRDDNPALLQEFKKVVFWNKSATAATLILSATYGQMLDTYISLRGELPVTDIANAINTPAKYDLNAGNSYTQTIAVDTTRKAILIFNLDDAEFWVGDSNVAPASERGVPLSLKGDNIILSCTAAITVKSNSLTAKFSVLSLQKI